MVLMIMTTVVVVLMILRANDGEGDDGNSVDDADYAASNDGGVDCYDVILKMIHQQENIN